MSKRDNIVTNNKAHPKGKGLGWASNIYLIGIGGIGMSALGCYKVYDFFPLGDFIIIGVIFMTINSQHQDVFIT